MRSYEGIFIFPPESTPEVRKNQVKGLDDLIAKFKGQVTQKTEWGKKQMGYSLRKFSEGFILVYDFQMDPSGATDFRKGLELQEDLLKFMVTLKQQEKLQKKPAKAAAANKSANPETPSAQAATTA